MRATTTISILFFFTGCAARTVAPVATGTDAPIPSTVVQPLNDEPTPTPEDQPTDPILRQLLDAHNDRREEFDLPALTLAPKLTDAAREHALAMARTGKLDHVGPEDGSTFAERIDRADYHHRTAAENIAEGATNVPDVMDDWMNSPGHKRNILGDFEQMGAARAKDEEGRWFWAVEFATPWPQVDRAAAPAEVLRQLNERRAAKDLVPLKADPELASVAAAMAKELAAHGEAKGFDSAAAFDRLKSRNVRFRQATVSVSVGHGTPAELVDALTKQADADKSLLGDFTRLGVGTATTNEAVPCWFLLLAR